MYCVLWSKTKKSDQTYPRPPRPPFPDRTWNTLKAIFISKTKCSSRQSVTYSVKERHSIRQSGRDDSLEAFALRQALSEGAREAMYNGFAELVAVVTGAVARLDLFNI